MNAKSYTLAELASRLNAELKGDPHCVINGVAPLGQAQAGQISFLENPRYKPHLKTTKASAVVINPKDTDICQTNNILFMKTPYLGYVLLAQLFSRATEVKPGIHNTVIIGEDCEIASNVSIGPYTVIGNRVKLAEGVVIGAGCMLGDGVTVQENTRLAAKVTLYPTITIGKRVILHSGVVIGSDGFGYAPINDTWLKIPQLGSVRIGDDVEIGANTSIDCGALGDTVIEEGVKIDNLTQVGHNAHIGAHTAIAGCVAIAGSAIIGKNCRIGGASAIAGHLEIVDNVTLAGATAVTRAITEPGAYGSITMAQPVNEWRRNTLRFTKLDELAKKVDRLAAKLSSAPEQA